MRADRTRLIRRTQERGRKKGRSVYCSTPHFRNKQARSGRGLGDPDLSGSIDRPVVVRERGSRPPAFRFTLDVLGVPGRGNERGSDPQRLSPSHSVFGAFYRARSARSSSEEAVVATAHKLARVPYHMLTYREAFTPESIRDFDQKRQQREVRHLQKRAKALGFALQPLGA